MAELPKITLIARDGKLIALDWFTQKSTKLLGGEEHFYDIPHHSLDNGVANHRLLKQTIGQLDEYFAGQRSRFDIALDLTSGTPFQELVWRTLLTISHGQTISYAELAKRIGKPTAYRACANANGKNPISLIIPCHRVIASDGGLGGYTGGIDIKKALLAHEAKYA